MPCGKKGYKTHRHIRKNVYKYKKASGFTKKGKETKKNKRLRHEFNKPF